MKKYNVDYNLNSFIYFLMLLLSSSLGVVFIPILTFYLIPVEIGIFSIANMSIMVATGLFYYAMMSGILRFFPIYKKNGEERSFILAVFLLLVCTSILVLLLWFTILFKSKNLLQETLYSILMYGGFIAVFILFWKGLATLFQAQENARSHAIIVGSESLLRYTLAILFLFMGVGVFSFFIGAFISSAIGATILALRFLRDSSFNRRIVFKVMRELTLYGYPLIFSAISMWLLAMSDTYMLAYLQDAEQVGIYTVGYVIPFQSITIITLAILTTMEPAIMNSWENEGEKEALEKLDKFAKQIFIVGIPIIIGGTILSKNIYQLFTSVPYHEAYQIFLYIVLGGFFWALYKVAYSGLYIMKRTKTIALILFLAGMVNIILNFMLIPKFSYSGAAITTMISYILLFFMAKNASKKYMHWKIPYYTMGKAIIASVMMGFLLYGITLFFVLNQMTLFLVIITGILFYIILLYLMKSLEEFPYGLQIKNRIDKMFNGGGL